MTFGNYCDSVPTNIEILIEYQLLNSVEYCKYLGIICDYNVKWNKYDEYLL